MRVLIATAFATVLFLAVCHAAPAPEDELIQENPAPINPWKRGFVPDEEDKDHIREEPITDEPLLNPNEHKWKEEEQHLGTVESSSDESLEKNFKELMDALDEMDKELTLLIGALDGSDEPKRVY